MFTELIFLDLKQKRGAFPRTFSFVLAPAATPCRQEGAMEYFVQDMRERERESRDDGAQMLRLAYVVSRRKERSGTTPARVASHQMSRQNQS
jgi:hypothetical protein